ncbi:MAG TPA: hypothetical protein VF681_15090 [Abditibacteriaceae bacterium]|jgi:hypothetical protein
MDIGKVQRANHFAALISPILLACVAALLLGWPVEYYWPLTPLFVASWFGLTIYARSRCTREEVLPSSAINCALIGFFLGGGVLILAFFVPDVATECGTTYYHYSMPAFNNWVQNVAEKLDNSGCG